MCPLGCYKVHYLTLWLKLFISLLAGGMLLNNVAQILLPDIEAENGVVHVISHALIPPADGIIG